jgi:GNAT superfamily N-acetyltransferase
MAGELTPSPAIARVQASVDAAQLPLRSGHVSVHGFGPRSAGPLVDRYINVGVRLQRDDPRRRPVPTNRILQRLAPDFPFYAYGTAHHLIVRRDGMDVGRCTALVNPRAQRDTAPLTGNIGMWECDNDLEAAHALLDAAIAWLAGHGCSRIVGPVDFSTWYGHRFTIGPWDAPFSTLEPASSPWSASQWEHYGFREMARYITTIRTDLPTGIPTGDGCLNQALAAGYTFRHIRARDMLRMLRMMHAQATNAFSRAPESAPLDWEEFEALYSDFARSVDPRLVWCAFAPDGSLAGLALATPDAPLPHDFNVPARMVVRRARSWWARQRADRVILKTIFVHPDHQGLGLSVVLTQRVWQTAYNLGYHEVAHALMHASNRSLANSERAGMSVFRTYGLYEMCLPR